MIRDRNPESGITDHGACLQVTPQTPPGLRPGLFDRVAPLHFAEVTSPLGEGRAGCGGRGTSPSSRSGGFPAGFCGRAAGRGATPDPFRVRSMGVVAFRPAALASRASRMPEGEPSENFVAREEVAEFCRSEENRVGPGPSSELGPGKLCKTCARSVCIIPHQRRYVKARQVELRLRYKVRKACGIERCS